MARKRLNKEIQEVMAGSTNGLFRRIQPDESGKLLWEGVFCPDAAPYDQKGFNIEITFPHDYPHKPPVVQFQTKVYHPNVDEDGKVVFDAISPNNWDPAKTVKDVIAGLNEVFQNPIGPAKLPAALQKLKDEGKKIPPIKASARRPGPLRDDVWEEYKNDKDTFLKKAEDFTAKNGVQCPDISRLFEVERSGRQDGGLAGTGQIPNTSVKVLGLGMTVPAFAVLFWACGRRRRVSQPQNLLISEAEAEENE